MTTTAVVTTNIASKPALSSDWVDTHADYLCNFAVGQVRDTSVAEELVQETFLAAVIRAAKRRLFDDFLGGFGSRYVIHDQIRAGIRERQRDGLSNAGIRARHQRLLAL